MLVCQRPPAELDVDSLAVTVLKLRTADGAPLGPAPELIDDAFYEVVGEVHPGGIPVLRVHAVRPARAGDHDCQAPTKPGESDESDESDEPG